MAAGKKRMSIQGLVPNEDYVIQVRAKDDGLGSQWSQKYNIKTIDDTAGGTRTPVICSLASFEINAGGTFLAVWPTVNANTDGTALVVNRYEVKLDTPVGSYISPHYGASGESQSREYSLDQIKAFFGTVPATVTASIRVINSAGTPSPEWSNEITVAIPVPYPPTMVVPPGLPVIDGIKVMWGPPAEPFVPGDPRWPLGYRVYVGQTSDFVPDSSSMSNMIYQGSSLEALYTTMSYEQDHFFKVCSYSAADLQSEFITIGPYRPISPYGPDDEPPTVPTLNEPTMNEDRTVSGQANLTWVHDVSAEQNKDTAGFVVAWKLTTDTAWRNSYFSAAPPANGGNTYSGVIDLPRAFANYDFKIAAYDFVGNYSAYSAVRTLSGAGDAPGALTGVDGLPRWDGIRLLWNHSESQGVINGGRYEVQFRSINSFTDDVPDYTTGNKELDIAGLQPVQSDWYWRVRAVDVMSRPGPWSAVQEETLPAFPTGGVRDGDAPDTAPANPRTSPGLNYINVSWDTVPNNDAVTYEVFASTTANFTAGPNNFAGATPANSLMVNRIPGGPNNGVMAQATTYYFKVRATDLDGAGPVSTETSGQLTQIAAGDLGISMGGENLLYNTSFEADSNGDSLADHWSVYNNSTGTEPHTVSRPTGRTGGVAQRVSWTGINTTVKGIKPYNQDVLRPHTEYTLSFYAQASAASTFAVQFPNNAPAVAAAWLFNPTATNNTWQRYAVKWTTGATVDPSGFNVTVVGLGTSGGWVQFDDIQLEAGNIASAYKVGTTSISKLSSGTMETAVMTIAGGGQIVSTDYDLINKTGFLISSAGINLLGGTVNAAALMAETTISEDLYIGSKLQVATDGFIQSSDYDTSGGTLGYRITNNAIDIRSGTVAANALATGTMTAAEILLGANAKMIVDAATASIESNNYSFVPANGNTPASGTGWKISSTGIEMWDTASKISVAALESGTLDTAVITMGSNGIIKSDLWTFNTTTGEWEPTLNAEETADPAFRRPRWKLSTSGLHMTGGTIEGATIITDQIYSAKKDTNDKYFFSINPLGYAEFSGALIHGNMRVSDGASNVIQSGNYNQNGVGWQIRGDGFAQFFNVNTWGMNIYNNAVVAGAANHSISSASFSSVQGWVIRGDGTSEFNGGHMRLGNVAGGYIYMTHEGGNGQIRFYQPGATGNYHYIKSVGQEFWINGGYGGYIHFAANNTVYMATDVYVSSSINGASLVSRGGIHATTNVTAGTHVSTPMLLGDPQFGWVNTNTQNLHYAVFGREGRISRGNQYTGGSSRTYKKNIHTLGVDADSVMALEPKTFEYNEEWDFLGSGTRVGFIAEEAESLGLGLWVHREEDSVAPINFDYQQFGVAQQVALRDHHGRIRELEAEVAKLKRLVAGS